jgi:hypothetical protein
VGDQVFIRIRPNKSTIRFRKGTKLSPRFIGPFKIHEKIGPIAYHLVLPPHLHKVYECLNVIDDDVYDATYCENVNLMNV